MPATLRFIRSSAPAVLPLVSMNSVTSSGTDSTVSASIFWGTSLSNSAKSPPARFASGALPRFTETLIAISSVPDR